MTKTIDYFPAKLAKGEQFCNRIKEIAILKRNIELIRPTVLISPRRYGKSSLAHKIAAKIEIPFVSIDLFLAHDDKTVAKRILEGISDVVSKIVPVTQKAITAIQKYFSNFRVTFNSSGFGLELAHTAEVIDAANQIYDALKSLANLAKEKNKKILFFIDEFQDITNAESSKSIQGVIRHVAQDSSSIIFIFSGSSRHLLLDLFDDKSKPLYMLCDKIMLDRMMSTDYYPHIQKAAQIKWGKKMHEMVVNRILALTELHPFYVNLLCNELWKNDDIPSIENVTAAWSSCYEIEERRLIAELEKLTSNQQDILKALAINPTKEPTGKSFLILLRLSLSSVRMGIKSLQEKDMIYVVKNHDPNLANLQQSQYRVLDPLLAFALRKYN